MARARARFRSGMSANLLVESLTRGTGGGSATRTLIVVSHRLAAVCPAAQRVVVFREGRVVEQGTHAQLLGEGGEYARLWRAQQASERDGDEQSAPRP